MPKNTRRVTVVRTVTFTTTIDTPGYPEETDANIIIANGAQLSLNGLGTETSPTYVPGNPAAISTFAVGGGPNTVTITGAGPGGSSAAIIEGAGHFTQVEKPEEFNRLVIDFIQS
jgi:hypothetical protein